MSNPNLALARRWIDDVWNRRSLDTIDELVDRDCVWHYDGGDVHGAAAYKRFHALYVESFPDLHVAVEGILAEGDEVVIRWRTTATHDGLGVKATHEPVSYRGMSWHRYRAGRLVEGWACWNQGTFFQKIQ